MNLSAAVEEPTEIKLHLRAMDRDEDFGFIMNSWARSWSLSEQNARTKDRHVARDFHELVREGIMREPDTQVLIGCDAAHPRYILCWLAYTPGRVLYAHYAYTRPHFDDLPIRRRGFFAILLHTVGLRDGGEIAYTFRPQARSHPNSNQKTGLEDGLLEAAARRGIAARYQPVEEFLGRGR